MYAFRNVFNMWCRRHTYMELYDTHVSPSCYTYITCRRYSKTKASLQTTAIKVDSVCNCMTGFDFESNDKMLIKRYLI